MFKISEHCWCHRWEHNLERACLTVCVCLLFIKMEFVCVYFLSPKVLCVTAVDVIVACSQ